MPKSWFPVNSPNLSASMQGPAWALSTVFANITYIALQTRIKTATDGWLDIISGDFFGTNLPRLTNEIDSAFRSRILANLFVRGPTRDCMVNVLALLTGRAPDIFEPSNTTDSGGWDGSIYWDVQGKWGDPLPYESFVTAYLPSVGLIDLGEWDELIYWDTNGFFSDASQTAINTAVIISAVESTRVIGTLIWLRIST